MDLASQKDILIDLLVAIKKNKPLVHVVTNFVVMNTTANALLAIGAAPTMSWAKEDVEYLCSISDSLCINIGTPYDERIFVMESLLKVAEKSKKPVVLDPVGSGAGPFRTALARRLNDYCTNKIVRGNVSEIISLYFDSLGTRGLETKGVDSTLSLSQAKRILIEHGRVNESDSKSIDFLSNLFPHDSLASSFLITGETDHVLSANNGTHVIGGHQLMSCVTGMGCILSAITAAFYAVSEHSAFKASLAASLMMKIAGHIAGQKVSGPGYFMPEFLDALYQMDEKTIASHYFPLAT